ncbi:putative sporulation protein YtxC [Paenibacillus phyllosphaerae]|uniref:Putative sporulation protein YtxC n=1 Tax=Paenibacillus phyllosphaerae TaxID=274593 RepID=A0A7W5ATC8_9BACL|nr:putative sporulation protein YtxC [Paenibacillus phyllosphaerae]MBB3108378.1 putative sporulation protein YtxC [Paenibacillus phyllosphaerae]
MELFTVSLMSASDEAMERLERYLHEEFADLHSNARNSDRFQLHITRAGQEIRCLAELPQFRLEAHGQLVYRKAALAFAQYILTELEPLLIKAIIRKQFNYEHPDEAEAVERYCRNLLIGPEQAGEDSVLDDYEADRLRRKLKVADELEAFLNQHARIHLDGFVTFRLAPYWEELREVAAYAVDEYVMDKQYQEFISVLKYFVRMQEVKMPIVHVLHKGGSEFALYDENFDLLESAPADRIVVDMLESEMNMEDMIVSTLITVSPKQIVIHTRQPELAVMRTLETIFEQRVKLCVACEHCGEYFEETVHQPDLVRFKRIRT